MNETELRPIRIVLADDHELVLEGLRGLLQHEPDMQIVAAVTDGEALLAAIEREQPDIVVMDLAMPTRDGFSCLDAIRRMDLPIKVVILTAFGDGGAMQSAWERQADGFALKSDPLRQTVSTIRNVAHGQIVFPRAVRQAMSRSDQQRQLLMRLTVRERAVLRLLGEGLANTQIAERLVIQESTVKFHLQNIFRKLGVANRTEAAQLYYREGQSAGE